MWSLESNRRKAWAAVLLAALVALPAASQTMEAPAVSTMRANPGAVSWEPLVSYDKLVLTVQGGGFASTREFTGGGVHFAPVDPEGYQLPDGTYSWEIRVIRPALELNDTLIRSDRQWDNGRSRELGTAPEPLVQSGSFTIANGAIADPTLEEEREPRGAAQQAARSVEVDDSDAANQ